MAPDRKKTIILTPELHASLSEFKALARNLEKKLNRTLNVIDIVGEIEVAACLNLELVEDLINPGFDAYEGAHRIQIKATRAKGSNSRISKITNNNGQLDFDFIILAKYKHGTDFELEDIYKASRAAIDKHFSYINANDKKSLRSNAKTYKDMAISQFISTAEFIYDHTKKTFAVNPKCKQKL